jgi:CheY-like chemotaxis protein
MPKMDGLEVAKEMFAVNPHQRIVFASAYLRDTLLVGCREAKQIGTLDLLRKINQQQK